MTITGDGNTDCPCCGGACPDGKKCFQIWTAIWNCVGMAWTGPTAGGSVCLPIGTDTGWVQTGKDGTGCAYRKYVPYSPKHCCTADGDCSGLGNTDTPTLPSVGAPADCCGCTEACMIVAEGCCGFGVIEAPGTFEITIVAISSSPNCNYNTVSPFSVDLLDVSALAGQTFTLPHVPTTCDWQDTFDVTASVKMLRCVGDGSGCAACTPTTNILTNAMLTITYGPGGSTNFGLTITCTGGDLDDGTQAIVVHNPTLDDDFVDCCTPFTASTTHPMPDGTVNEVYMDMVAGTSC